MACLSNIREVKDLIGSLLCQNLCNPDTSMRYIKLGEDLDSVEGFDDLMQDMFTVEKLNLDLNNLTLDMNIKTFCDVSSSGSDSMNGSDMFGGCKSISASCSEDSISHGTSVVYRSLDDTGLINSYHDNSETKDTQDASDCTVVMIRREEVEEVEAPYKYVVTYQFDFDTEDEFENDISNFENDLSDFENDISDFEKDLSECLGDVNSVDTTDNNMQRYSDDEDFEDDFFNSDCDINMDKFNLTVNGSKNNLLDDRYTPEEYSSHSVGLVDYDSTSGDENSDRENDDYVDLYQSPLKCERLNTEPQIQQPTTPSMRKGFIYYSSELRLYSGELNYEPMVPEKKYKFMKKLFKRVFPTTKYVVNA